MIDWAVHIAVAVAVALLIVNYVAQITVVKGPSMLPTLQDGNRLIIEKISPRTGKLERGDIVTVNVPEFLESGKETIIKRVIGLEGDKVEIRKDGKVYVNDKVLQEDYINGLVTNVIEPEYGRITVPKGSIYVMGDNRQNSKDSRTIGPVGIEKISGKVILRIFPINQAGKI